MRSCSWSRLKTGIGRWRLASSQWLKWLETAFEGNDCEAPPTGLLDLPEGIRIASGGADIGPKSMPANSRHVNSRLRAALGYFW